MTARMIPSMTSEAIAWHYDRRIIRLSGESCCFGGILAMSVCPQNTSRFKREAYHFDWPDRGSPCVKPQQPGGSRSQYTITVAQALEAAQRADQELAKGINRGPLHGIPSEPRLSRDRRCPGDDQLPGARLSLGRAG